MLKDKSVCRECISISVSISVIYKNALRPMFTCGCEDDFNRRPKESKVQSVEIVIFRLIKEILRNEDV